MRRSPRLTLPHWRYPSRTAPRAGCNRSRAFLAKNQFDKALADCKQALNINQKDRFERNGRVENPWSSSR